MLKPYICVGTICVNKSVHHIFLLLQVGGSKPNLKKKDDPSNVGQNQLPTPANIYGFVIFQPPTTNEG